MHLVHRKLVSSVAKLMTILHLSDVPNSHPSAVSCNSHRHVSLHSLQPRCNDVPPTSTFVTRHSVHRIQLRLSGLKLRQFFQSTDCCNGDVTCFLGCGCRAYSLDEFPASTL
jgi:hypothetical protein